MTFRTWKDLQIDVPEGSMGQWTVDKWTPDPIDPSFAIFNMKAGARSIPPGYTYTRLLNGRNVVVMSDTPAELNDLWGILHKVRKLDNPTVLIHGLGLGCVLNGCFMEGASKVTVVEKDADVIALVGPHWKERYGDQLEIIHGDAFTWQPPKGARWDLVYHDIWNDLCTDNLQQMGTLHRRFGRRCGEQLSWCRSILEAQRRRERRERRIYGFQDEERKTDEGLRSQ
jgi:hypothetical protein